MAKIWVDPSPAGWQYGFPKLYDEDKDGPSITEWMIKEGYPRSLAYECITRQWAATNE